MKKILSLLLGGVMLVSSIPVAFATNTYDSSNPESLGTQVSYVGNGAEAYTVTVPALMKPGDSANVNLQGTWSSDRVISVTADDTVKLYNQINNSDYKELTIHFEGFKQAGDNTQARSYDKTIRLDQMPSDALFGTWSGTFYYNVSIDELALADRYWTYGLNNGGMLDVTLNGNKIEAKMTDAFFEQEGITPEEFAEIVSQSTVQGQLLSGETGVESALVNVSYDGNTNTFSCDLIGAGWYIFVMNEESAANVLVFEKPTPPMLVYEKRYNLTYVEEGRDPADFADYIIFHEDGTATSVFGERVEVSTYGVFEEQVLDCNLFMFDGIDASIDTTNNTISVQGLFTSNWATYTLE